MRTMVAGEKPSKTKSSLPLDREDKGVGSGFA
jgi:hypothetical protein